MLNALPNPRHACTPPTEPSTPSSTRSFPIALPGAPCIYYGDEIGLSAAGDPYCREAFPWDKEEWDMDLLSFYRAATALRHQHEVLRTGRVEVLQAEGQTLVFRRTRNDQTAIVAFNAGTKATNVEIAPSALPTAAFSSAWPPATNAGVALQDAASPVRIPSRETRVRVTD